jgi:ABC-type transport system involved in cytochrome bd biosynthesis fused ATPase/permease subunit
LERQKNDPATNDAAPVVHGSFEAWRLERIEASAFGGLTLFEGDNFDFWTGGDNWCLLGQNGSGKTSLASAILWALTGKRIREQDGPVDETGARLCTIPTVRRLVTGLRSHPIPLHPLILPSRSRSGCG